MKFVTDLHIIPSSNGKFHINTYSKRHYINDVTKFAHICHTLRPTWTKFGTQDIYKNLFRNLECRENGWNENHVLLNGVDEFLTLLSTFGGPL